MEARNVILKLTNVNKTFILSENRKDGLKHKLFSLFSNAHEKRSLHALKNISLEIYKGETIGIIGGNGSGKSTLTKIMTGTYLPDKNGIVERHGTVMLMNLGVGMSHELTARQNIYISSSVLGMKRKIIDQHVDEILAFAELEDFADTKIKFFSTGMIQRLSFSVAVNAGADIIFLDEVFAVGDEKFRRRAIEVLEKNWINERTVVMVSHGLANISKYCDRCIYLKKGDLVFFGDSKEAIRLYQEDNESDSPQTSE